MKYVIIDAESIQRKIEELHKICVEGGFPLTAFNADLEQILSQSTPLIPEIEKAFDTGKWGAYSTGEEVHSAGDYITNLKLSI